MVSGLAAALGDVFGRGDRRGASTAFTHRAEEEIFPTPHHAFGHAGRAVV